MTRTDREHWEAGDSINIGNYRIVPKRDFGTGQKHQHGWVVTKGACNILPGATWARSMDEAKKLLNCFIAAGGDELGETREVAQRFWAFVELFNSVCRAPATKPEPKKPEQKVAELFAKAYASLANTEYNLTGHLEGDDLVAFRKALRLLKIDINPYLPSECPRVGL